MITPVIARLVTEAQRIHAAERRTHCTGAYGDVVVVE